MIRNAFERLLFASRPARSRKTPAGIPRRQSFVHALHRHAEARTEPPLEALQGRQQWMRLGGACRITENEAHGLPFIDQACDRLEAAAIVLDGDGGEWMRDAKPGVPDRNADSFRTEIECEHAAAGIVTLGLYFAAFHCAVPSRVIFRCEVWFRVMLRCAAGFRAILNCAV